MNRGGIGARSLNIELQAALNPAGERKVERFGWTFAPGDKVMQIENDYDKEVYNGDIGYIDDVDPDDGELTASFDGRTSPTGLANSTRWCRPTPRPSTKARARNIRRGDTNHDAALRHAAAKFALYRRHSGQEAGRAGRPEEGCRHRGSQRVGSAALVEVE
jgi:ATP-dependent RecD-like DNA helicase SH3 domain